MVSHRSIMPICTKATSSSKHKLVTSIFHVIYSAEKCVNVGNQSSRTDGCMTSKWTSSLLMTCQLSSHFPTASFSCSNPVRYLCTSCGYMRALAWLEGNPLCFIVMKSFVSMLINVLGRLCHVSVMMAPVDYKSPENPATAHLNPNRQPH